MATPARVRVVTASAALVLLIAACGSDAAPDAVGGSSSTVEILPVSPGPTAVGATPAAGYAAPRRMSA